MAGRILSISYDPMLLQTTHSLLEQQGYTVTSAEGFAEAFQHCERGLYDLVIMGHSIPHKDKEAVQTRIEQLCPAPILVLLRKDEPPLRGAAASIDPMNVKAFLRTVDSLIEKRSAMAP